MTVWGDSLWFYSQFMFDFDVYQPKTLIIGVKHCFVTDRNSRSISITTVRKVAGTRCFLSNSSSKAKCLE